MNDISVHFLLHSRVKGHPSAAEIVSNKRENMAFKIHKLIIVQLSESDINAGIYLTVCGAMEK